MTASDAAADPPAAAITSNPAPEDLAPAEQATDVVPQSEEQPQAECLPEVIDAANELAEEISMEAPAAACDEDDSPHDQADQVDQSYPVEDHKLQDDAPDYGPEEWEDMQIPEEWLPCPIVRVSYGSYPSTVCASVHSVYPMGFIWGDAWDMFSDIGLDESIRL